VSLNGFPSSAKGAEYGSQGQAPKARNMKARASAKGAEYESQGQAPKARNMKARASAKGAEYGSQGQARSASPLVLNIKRPSPERAKYISALQA